MGALRAVYRAPTSILPRHAGEEAKSQHRQTYSATLADWHSPRGRLSRFHGIVSRTQRPGTRQQRRAAVRTALVLPLLRAPQMPPPRRLENTIGMNHEPDSQSSWVAV